MLKIISHNQGVFVSIILCSLLAVWVYGCQSQVKSFVTGDKVNRLELTLELNIEAKRLEAELDNLQKQAELKFTELNRQDDIKAKVFDIVSVATTTNQFNLTGLITLMGSVLGLGAVVDNRIKDKVIKNRPQAK